jgi:hypothetical protein
MSSVPAAVPFDLRADPHEDVFDEVEVWLRVRLDRAGAAYGRSGATVGARTDRGTWVRVAWRRPWKIGPAWTGLEHASALRGVSRPELIRSVRWRDAARELVWRADELELVASAPVEAGGVVTAMPELGEAWWNDLRSSLAALAVFATERVGMPQAHLSRRIGEVFGDAVDTAVDEWATAHADLHWANLTAPECRLLDWEDWGRGPRGLDAATLWGHSLLVPALADRVLEEFDEDLSTRSGRLARLLFCANVLRLARRATVPSPLAEPARKAADDLLSSMVG